MSEPVETPARKGWSQMDEHERTNYLHAQAKRLGESLDERDSAKRLVGKSLCYSCSYGLIWKRRGYAHDTLRCTELNMTVPDDIDQCSGYARRNSLSLGHMAQIALDVEAT